MYRIGFASALTKFAFSKFLPYLETETLKFELIVLELVIVIT